MDNKVNNNKVLYDYRGVPPDAKEEGLFCLYRIEAKSRDATKLDKIKRSQIAKQVKLIRETLKMKSETIIIPFSAETKQGRDEIYTVIDSYITEETV